MVLSPPIQILHNEHRMIASVLDAVEAVAGGRHDPSRLPQSFYDPALDFFNTFVDRCHHIKEEKHLFPLLEARGLPQRSDLIAGLLSNHEDARRHLAIIRQSLHFAFAGDPVAPETVRRESLAYASLLRQHVSGECELLFAQAEQRLTRADQDNLSCEFARVDHATLFPRDHDAYVARAGELRKLAGL